MLSGSPKRRTNKKQTNQQPTEPGDQQDLSGNAGYRAYKPQEKYPCSQEWSMQQM